MSDNTRRITITIEDNVTDEEALDMALSVVRRRRISGKSYCLGTVRRDPHSEYDLICWSRKTRTGNDSFRVWRSERETK